ncbi:lysine N(6)-hydroxylase/L-ornithine N(5)-oxygenase family protein [Epibacterium mobile]|nr:lysine N(6)-hydroxylase/L-ornithine N(5)-oxygenase family protein [Tritonibacter mobilis]NHM24134.1 lysine N(6)-hydroxylase/L-ornithine N(5)-oxygenase family protein [Tritonibacter mobilis]
MVDGDLIDQIYGVFYEQDVTGTEPHRLWRNTQVHSALAVDDGVELTLSQRGDVSLQRYDLVILATGYTRRLDDTILSDLAPWLTADEAERSYQLPRRMCAKCCDIV